MSLMNPHYSNSFLCLLWWLWFTLTAAEKCQFMLGCKRSEKIGFPCLKKKKKDTTFPPVLIAKVFLSCLPLCTPINDYFFSHAKNGWWWLGGERVRVMQSLRWGNQPSARGVNIPETHSVLVSFLMLLIYSTKCIVFPLGSQDSNG